MFHEDRLEGFYSLTTLAYLGMSVLLNVLQVQNYTICPGLLFLLCGNTKLRGNSKLDAVCEVFFFLVGFVAEW